MHIAVAAPASLELLKPWVNTDISVPGYPFPGTSFLILEYLNQGHQVSLVTTSPGLPRPAHFSGPQLTISVVPSRPRARSRVIDLFRQERRGIEAELRKSGGDVCHAHWTYEFALAAQRTRMPLVITVHDWAPHIAQRNQHPYWYVRVLMQRQCLGRRGVFTAPSSYLVGLVRSRRPDVRLVPNGVDLSLFDSPSRRLPQGRDVAMLNVGFSQLKNVKSALLAWPIVLQQFPESRLLLAGPDYEPGGSAESWARENALTRQVAFLGPLEPSAVPRFLSQARCFLHTSLEESFGVAVVEAMAAGTPVVVGADAGALPDLVGDAGFLTDVTDHRAIAGSVVEALRSPDEVLNHRRVQGRTIAAKFDIRSVAQTYLELLEAEAHLGVN